MSDKKMKSARMTKQLRFSIKNKAIDWKFAKEEAKLEERAEKLAVELYDVICSPDVLAYLHSMPDCCCKHDSEIPDNRNFRETIDPTKPNSTYLWSYEGLRLKFPEVDGRREERIFPHGFNLVSAEDGKWIKSRNQSVYGKLVRYATALNSFYKRRYNFTGKVEELLESVNSTKKLLDVLPEASEWIPEVCQCSNIPVADKAAELMAI